MVRKLKTNFALMAAAVVLSGQAYAGSHGGGPSAEALAYTCAGCHGTNGVSTGPATPSLAGLSKEYMMTAMAEYKDGSREATIMDRIAKGYSEAEVGRMADFFAAQKTVPVPGQKFDAAKAAAGKKLHDKYCDKCHENGGTSPGDDAGLLSGNTVPFLRNSMVDFADGTRSMPKKMKKAVKKAKKKDADAIDKLMNFYSSAK